MKVQVLTLTARSGNSKSTGKPFSFVSCELLCTLHDGTQRYAEVTVNPEDAPPSVGNYIASFEPRKSPLGRFVFNASKFVKV